MPAKRAQTDPCCKWCNKSLVSTPNPLVANPGPKDMMKRRTPCSVECRPCFLFQKTHPYCDMSRVGLQEHLPDSQNLETYLSGLEEYCAERRSGKRRGADAGAGSDATYAETSSSLSTKQVVGYFWPVELLKKHSKPLPKKLSSLTHQGRVLKGVTLEEFAVGAIEVATTSSRGAKRLVELAHDDSENEGEAASAFDMVQKKVRVSGSTAEGDESSEITLKMAGRVEDDTDELHSILFGDVGKTRKEKGASDDEQQAAKRRATVRNKKAASLGNACVGQEAESTGGAAGSNPDGSASTSSNSAWALSGASLPSKKAAAEAKELDKAEALVLSVNQLKGQLGEETSVMQVSLKSVRSLCDKVTVRLNHDGSKLFLDAVKRNGPACRAASVWQALKDSKACLEAVDEFVEALHDSEASPDTVRSRGAKLKDFSIQLPRNVNIVICKKNAEEFVQQGKLDELFAFMDPTKSTDDTGIMTVLPDTENEDDRKEMIRDFQVGCVTHLVNNLLLKEFAGDAASKEFEDENKKFMKSCVQSLKDFLAAFQKSDVYQIAAPEKSQFRDDLGRISQLTEYVLKGDALLASECDSLHSMKAAVSKKGFSFQAGIVTFPVGSWMMDTIGEMIAQCRQDQLLGKEFESVVQFAQGLKITVDYMTKKDKETGAIDITIPNLNKKVDMAAKYFALMDSASSTAKKMLEPELEMVRDRIELLATTLVEATALKYEEFFGKLNQLLTVCFSGGEWGDEKSSEVVQSLQTMQAFQPWSRIQLARLVGKSKALILEKHLSSMSSLGSALQKSFPKLVSLKTATLTESLLMSSEIRTLYSAHHDQDVLAAVKKPAPKMLPGIDAITTLISKAVADFLCKAASTFGDFLTGILEAEPVFDSILQSKVVGTVDPPEMDEKGVAKIENEIDFGALYVAFNPFFAEDKTAKLAISDKQTISVHTSFLCVAGSQLQLSKYVLSVKEGMEAANSQGDFKTVIGLQFQHAAQKDATGPKTDTKLSLLNTVPHFFPGLTKASQSYQEIMSKAGATIANSDQIKFYHKKLLETLVASIQLGLKDCGEEIDSMQGFFTENFEKIRASHAVPGVFRASVLDRETISKLCQDENVKVVLFCGSKAGLQCSMMQHYLQSVKTLTFIQTEVGSEVTSLIGMLDAFSSSNNAKTMPPEDAKVNLANVTYLQGSVSLAQSMVRNLNPGETRTGLISKCMALLTKTKVTADVILTKKANQALAGK